MIHVPQPLDAANPIPRHPDNAPTPAQAALLADLEALGDQVAGLRRRFNRVLTLRWGARPNRLLTYLEMSLAKSFELYRRAEEEGGHLDLIFIPPPDCDRLTPAMTIRPPGARVIHLMNRSPDWFADAQRRLRG